MDAISRLLKEPEWDKEFSERERKEISFCHEYTNTYNHGTDGHLVRTIVAKMAVLLDMMERENKHEYALLSKIANGECTCSDDVSGEKCDVCKASGVLNEVGEIIRGALKE